jgi:hypothetical protein
LDRETLIARLPLPDAIAGAHSCGDAPIDPGWSLPGTGGHIEAVLPELKALDMFVANINGHQATIDAFAKSGRLNHIAALLSGLSDATSLVVALLGAYQALIS